ncbi:MAG: bifunctional phosphoribosyl-AMP cyclohydrolase/phosphoribosyl-ATP diphosphatase HisIE [Melioribacteraceae bacterium]
MIKADELNFEKLGGLIPVVVTDSETNQVLMLGFMNKEAFEKTIETKRVTFFSRTRNTLWTKGETSGNFLNLIDIKEDCDNDSLLLFAKPDGPTCHKGTYSCFGIKKNNSLFINQLSQLIRERKENLPENSYTTKLFKEGADRIIQKVGEEAIETVIAAKNRDKEEIINETSDLIYHLLVMLAEQEIGFDEVVNKLISRHQIKPQ